MSGIPAAARRRLVEVLRRAQEHGVLGPGDPQAHLDQALGLAARLAVPDRFVDLGSGAGIPGLVLALAWPTAHGTLLDASIRRCELLAEAVQALGLEGRVLVRAGRAETLGHDPDLRERAELVTARAFGPPAVTAECGAPFVAVGGCLAVTEPPASTAGRWPEDPLRRLGLVREETRTFPGGSAVILRKVERLDARYPRRDGVPAKRPLWRPQPA